MIPACSLRDALDDPALLGNSLAGPSWLAWRALLLAATLVLRAMIDFSLTKSRSGRYRHAARHLMACVSLAPSIPDFGTFETHEIYVAKLKAEHGKKTSFWSLMS